MLLTLHGRSVLQFFCLRDDLKMEMNIGVVKCLGTTLGTPCCFPGCAYVSLWPLNVDKADHWVSAGR